MNQSILPRERRNGKGFRLHRNDDRFTHSFIHAQPLVGYSHIIVWTKCVKASGKRLCTRVCVVNVGLMTAGGLKGLGAAKDKVSK